MKSHLGLTKQEYFAAQALQGLLANPRLVIADDEGWLLRSYIADTAVQQADALIEALYGDRS